MFPTPVTRAARLERALRRGPLHIKRDDLAGFAVAGNKTRPLEFLIGDAVARGVEVLVTGGGPGSNFCPAAALAASAAGIACELVVWGEPDSPNLALARAAGAILHPTGGTDREAVDEQAVVRAAELNAQGRRALALPRGGSTPLGAVGFAAAAAELPGASPVIPGGPGEGRAELPDAATIVIPVGSGGSCAGLLAGLAGSGADHRVVGVSVSRPLAEIEPKVRSLAAECAALLGTAAPDPARLTMVDARGAGFGVAAPRERELAALALRTEGLLFDPTYGAKALAVAADLAGPVLLWHTGGVLPALTKGLP